MTEASRHLILLPSYFFLSDRRVPPGECGFTSGDGDPGTNGVITKLAAERRIKAKSANLQAVLSQGAPGGRADSPCGGRSPATVKIRTNYSSAISSGNSFAFDDVL